MSRKLIKKSISNLTVIVENAREQSKKYIYANFNDIKVDFWS